MRSYGQPAPPPAPAVPTVTPGEAPDPGIAAFDDPDATWVNQYRPGDFISVRVAKDTWVQAKIVQFSEFLTEVEVAFPGLEHMGYRVWYRNTEDCLAPYTSPDAKQPAEAPAGAAAAEGGVSGGAGAGAGAGAGGAEAEVDAKVAAEQQEARAREEAAMARWRAKLQPGFMCDAMDSSQKWYESVVVESKTETDDAGVETQKVKISFLGCDTTNDVWLPVTSSMLAPLDSRSNKKRGDATVFVSPSSDRFAVIKKHQLTVLLCCH